MTNMWMVIADKALVILMHLSNRILLPLVEALLVRLMLVTPENK